MADNDPFAAFAASPTPTAPVKEKKARKPRQAKAASNGEAAPTQNVFLTFSHLLDTLEALPDDQTRKDLIAALVKAVK